MSERPSGDVRAIGPNRLVLAGVVPLLVFATWLASSIDPEAGRDPSWEAALHMAAHGHRHFGSDLVFTYGPLGFLGNLALYYPLTAALAMLFTLAVQAAYCATVLFFSMRTLRLRIALAAVLTAKNASSAVVEERVPALSAA